MRRPATSPFGDGTEPRDPGRRTLLLGLAGAGALAALGGCRDDARGDATPSTSATPTTIARSPGGGDATVALQRALDAGTGRVVIPAGTYDISGELRVPWTVSELVIETGALIRQHADEAVLRRVGEITESPLLLSDARAGDPVLIVPGGVGDLDGERWIYACSDDWIKEGKSKRGILRSIVHVAGEEVGIDKPVLADLTEAPRAHLVRLAPPLHVGGGGILEQADPEALYANLIRLDFVADPTLEGLELRGCGGAAVRLFGTVGGTVDLAIHDCVDDEASDHYGYGVQAAATTRDLHVRGQIERVRHAFTTDHGWDPLVESIAQTGEPEDLLVEPQVADTTSTGIDTHEPGDGIVIVPHVRNAGTGKWGGINVRARNVTIRGGEVETSNEWGILIQESAGGGTRIEGTRVSGVADGPGVHVKSDTELHDVGIAGFGSDFGILVTTDTSITARGGRIDGGGRAGARGVGLQRGGSSLDGVTVADCDIGIHLIRGGDDTELRDVRFEDCDQNVVR